MAVGTAERGEEAEVTIAREWAMPNKNTFDILPIKTFVGKYMSMAGRISVDPFCGGRMIATYDNDINKSLPAQSHEDAEMYLRKLAYEGVSANLVLFDPPYSPRQISECYKGAGMECGMKETQSGLLYKRVRDAIIPILRHDGYVLSFGWNSVGMGKVRGFEIVEILLVCHGGAHNDTICMAERRGCV